MSLAQDPSPVGSNSLSFFRHAEREQVQPVPGLIAGKVVGDFRLVSLLGQGGMGQVWEAEQLSLGNRRVAVKFVRPERVTKHQLELFAREARAGGRLSHPGIVAVHGHGTSDDLAWIAMELVPGAWSLRDFLDEVSRAEEVPAAYDRDVARFVAEIADAVQAAHEAGVIHRDLKPQNVLITPDDRPKVTDFGLARITDESALSQTGDFAGTYFYMSPEQVTAKRMGIDHRSDVFSLGVVLYEMLALRRPFEGDTSHQIAEQIVTKDPPDPRSIRSKVPRDLVVIAGKALEKDRDRRYQTMAELAADLRRWLGNEPIHATPPTRVDRAMKWVKRNPTTSVATGLAGVAILIISILLGVNIRTNRELRAERTNLARANTSLEAERIKLATTNTSLEMKTKQAERSAAEALENARRANANEERANSEAEVAKRRADEMLRLSALQDPGHLMREVDRLWPAHPDNIERYNVWILRARELCKDLLPQQRALASLQAAMNDATTEPTWPAESLAAHILGLQVKIAKLEELDGLLAEDAIDRAHGWSMPKRVRFASSVAELSVRSHDAKARWAEALSSIADRSQCPVYAGLVLECQIGLLPIGRDPVSGLWEFAHLQTGEIADRGMDGKLMLKEETGLVFVLLPGGAFAMGAQSSDLGGLNFDAKAMSNEGPVHDVTLSPFFLSKYEMTQGQWLRFTGQNPSYYQPLSDSSIFLLHPVEQVSWNACNEVMERLGLLLPSEAQWEYGARAGTTSPWWTGSESRSLMGAVNLVDQAATQANKSWPTVKDSVEWNDGRVVHAVVNEYAPNQFGLHNVHGNVWEWCLDAFDSGFYSLASERDPVLTPYYSATLVTRGGGFDSSPVIARSALRGIATSEFAVESLGLRPARAITGSLSTSPLTSARK